MLAADAAAHTVTVTYDDSAVKAEDLKKALEAAGYVMSEAVAVP